MPTSGAEAIHASGAGHHVEISRDYPRPILANGFSGKTCDDVSRASPSQVAAADRGSDGGVKLSGLAAAKAAESATGPSTQPVGSCGRNVNVCC